MYGLTQRQGELLKFILQYTFRNMYQPSSREICDALGISSTNAVSDHLKALHRKGYIKFNSSNAKARALELTDKALDAVDIHDPLIRAIPRKRVITCPS